MLVIDESTGKPIPKEEAIKILTKICPDQIIFGYINCDKRNTLVPIYVKNSRGEFEGYFGLKGPLENDIVYSNRRGFYIVKRGLTNEEILAETLILGQGGFPYTFDRHYEAIENFDIFKNRQVILEKQHFELSKYCKYTFGLEFETSGGYIPEDICFQDGLIPLRDGSISGLEYSTVILSGDDGLSLLRQQLVTLNKYTSFNKECSLHVHMGGFKLSTEVVYNIYCICRRLESELSSILPSYSFKTSRYKNSHKDYCNKLNDYADFYEMYAHLVGRHFFGSFNQPHPNDPKRTSKWNIRTRYYWVNFINTLCYNINKTVEFRFLRPTFNFDKIYLWLGIFNAILTFAENAPQLNLSNRFLLKDILNSVYPPDMADNFMRGLMLLKIVSTIQNQEEDFIGADIYTENKILSENFHIS